MSYKYCSHGNCKSNSGKSDNDVSFVPFPKPHLDLRMAKKWVALCGRQDLKLKDINQSTFVCSKHFKADEDLDWKSNPTLFPTPAWLNKGCPLPVSTPSQQEQISSPPLQV